MKPYIVPVLDSVNKLVNAALKLDHNYELDEAPIEALMEQIQTAIRFFEIPCEVEWLGKFYEYSCGGWQNEHDPNWTYCPFCGRELVREL